MDFFQGEDTGLVVDWTVMPTYNTIMSLAAGAGLLLLLLLARSLHRDKDFRPEGWALASGALGFILTLTGAQMTLTWVGQHQMWAAQFLRFERPNAWLNSGSAGTMGYTVSAAMGAKLAQPERVVWAIDGDGCFQMSNQELATCAIINIPIKVAIINNSSLGMVRQWQTLFYDGRYSNTELPTGAMARPIPDFVTMAEAYGALGIRVTEPG